MTEPNESNEKILRTIRGLLDKANSTEFEGEADALTAKAMELMAKHQIDQAVLEATGKKAADTVSKITITFVNPFSHEKHLLLRSIAMALGCRTLRYPVGKSVSHTDVVGHTSDLERVEFLYTLLLVQAQAGAMKVKAPAYVVDTHYGYEQTRYLNSGQIAARTRAKRAGYLAGFADVIGERLTEITRHAAAQSDTEHTTAADSAPGAALVLASRKEAVNTAFTAFFPHTTTSRGRSYNTSGYAAGQAGGRRADLGQTRFSTGTRALAR